MVLISLALCADAVIGNVQEKALKAHKSSNTEMVSTVKPSPSEHLLNRKVFQGSKKYLNSGLSFGLPGATSHSSYYYIPANFF